jgi:hypothetical protein
VPNDLGFRCLPKAPSLLPHGSILHAAVSVRLNIATSGVPLNDLVAVNFGSVPCSCAARVPV